MKIKPMIFNSEMVKALLYGKKSVTRRPVSIKDGWALKDNKPTKITSPHPKKGKWGALIRKETFDNKYQHDIVSAPCWIEDLIYVRETFTPDPDADHESWDNHEFTYHEWIGCRLSPQFLPGQLKTERHCLFKADCDLDMVWTPSIHMPRWASRLTLKVTDVRIETLNELRKCEDQIKKEGFENWPQFKHVWESIYGQSNPNDYVWVIEFEVIHQNVDKYLEAINAGVTND